MMITTKLKKIKKPLIIISIVMASLFFLYSIFFKFYLSYNYSEKRINQYISNLFKENFKKAVTFSSITIDLFGDIIVYDLDVSITGDFNDNISLLKSKKSILGLKYLNIFKNQLIINNLEFKDAEITIYKKNGKSYLENFQDIFVTFHPLLNINEFDSSDLSIKFSNSILYYKEIFKNSRILIQCNDVDSGIKITKDKIEYSVNGIIQQYKSQEIDNGSFRISGELINYHENDNKITNNIISIDNFDISYLNPYASDYFSTPLFMHGGISTELRCKSINNNFSIDGGIDFNNLNISIIENNTAHKILANENLSLQVVLDILNNFKKIVFRNIDILDDNLKLCINGTFNNNRYKKFIDIVFKSNIVDLSNLSLIFSPLKNSSYSGSLISEGRLNYNFKDNSSKDSSLFLNIDKFNLKHYLKGVENVILNNSKLTLDLNKNILNLNISTKNKKSDFTITLKSIIQRWLPITSSSELSINSKEVESQLIFYFIQKFINSLYSAAYEDRNKGYEEVMFTETPTGILLNNNNIICNVNIKKIFFSNNAFLSDFKFNTELKKGDIKINEFSISGYNGYYYLRANLYFSWDYPRIDMLGKVKDFDIGSFTRDLGIDGNFTGNLNIDFDFFSSPYRLSHLIDNSTGKINVEIVTGQLSNTLFQKKITGFLKQNGFDINLSNMLDYNRISILFGKIGESFYIRNMLFVSNMLELNTQGYYSFYKGLNIPLSLNVKKQNDKDNSLELVKVPLIIKGPLLKPKISIVNTSKDRNEKMEMLLFDIH